MFQNLYPSLIVSGLIFHVINLKYFSEIFFNPEKSDNTDIFDSQSLFQNTAIRKKPEEPKSPSKSLLRTPTAQFRKRAVKGELSNRLYFRTIDSFQVLASFRSFNKIRTNNCSGKKWPINTENLSEESFDGKKNVSFSEKNEVREFSSQESTDVEIISASDEADDNQSQARIFAYFFGFLLFFSRVRMKTTV